MQTGRGRSHGRDGHSVVTTATAALEQDLRDHAQQEHEDEADDEHHLEPPPPRLLEVIDEHRLGHLVTALVAGAAAAVGVAVPAVGTPFEMKSRPVRFTPSDTCPNAACGFSWKLSMTIRRGSCISPSRKSSVG